MSAHNKLAHRHLFLAAASLVTLAGCMQTDEQIGWSNRMHTQIVAEETTAELKIDSIMPGEKLGLQERNAVRQFALAYQDEGHGAMIISRPSNGPDDISAMRASADARAVMLAEGIDQVQIAEGTYDGTGARSAPLIISYRTYNAVVPGCPDLSSLDLTDTSSNSAMPSLGCAVAVNLAAMIANPSDLVGDQPMDPADIGRRSIVLSKYRSGEKTSAERNDDASGAISSAVN
jgi:pilus assembly protein CpaD